MHTNKLIAMPHFLLTVACWLLLCAAEGVTMPVAGTDHIIPASQEAPAVVNQDRTMIQLLSGVGMGLLLGGSIAFVWSQVEGEQGPYDEIPHDEAVIFGGGGGYLLGSAMGVYVGGLKDERRGSFWACSLGSVLGFLAGGSMLVMAGDKAWPFLVLGPPMGAVLAYSASRPDAVSPAYGSRPVLKMSKHKKEWQVPTFSFKYSSRSHSWSSSIDLVRIDF